MCPDVSSLRVTLLDPLFFSFSFFLFFFFLYITCLRISPPIRISSTIWNSCSCTVVSSIRAFALFFSVSCFSSCFPRSLNLSFSISNLLRNEFLFFSFSLLVFLFVCSSIIHILAFYFSSVCFRVWFWIFLCFVLLLIFFFFIFRYILSCIFHDSVLLPSLFPFYFYLSFASSRASFESAFLRELFMSLALFHASVPPLPQHLPPCRFIPPFFPTTFSLISLAASPSSIYFDRS